MLLEREAREQAAPLDPLQRTTSTEPANRASLIIPSLPTPEQVHRDHSGQPPLLHQELRA